MEANFKSLCSWRRAGLLWAASHPQSKKVCWESPGASASLLTGDHSGDVLPSSSRLKILGRDTNMEQKGSIYGNLVTFLS